MSRKALDLVVASACAAIAMTISLQASDPGPARTLIMLPLVLFLPGYAITAAAFPGGELGAAERLLFSLGLSLAATICSGLLLHWTSLGLRPVAWAIVLGDTTLVFSLVALVRRWRWITDDAPGRGPGLTLLQGAQLGMAALLVGGALMLARDGATERRGDGFTQLWALPADASGQGSLRLGVSNHESKIMRYRLDITSDGRVIRSWPLIALAPDEQWEAMVALPARPGPTAFEAELYQLDTPETAYRRVVLWTSQKTN